MRAFLSVEDIKKYVPEKDDINIFSLDKPYLFFGGKKLYTSSTGFKTKEVFIEFISNLKNCSLYVYSPDYEMDPPTHLDLDTMTSVQYFAVFCCIIIRDINIEETIREIIDDSERRIRKIMEERIEKMIKF
jgi:hypothetical protein